MNWVYIIYEHYKDNIVTLSNVAFIDEKSAIDYCVANIQNRNDLMIENDYQKCFEHAMKVDHLHSTTYIQKCKLINFNDKLDKIYVIRYYDKVNNTMKIVEKVYQNKDNVVEEALKIYTEKNYENLDLNEVGKKLYQTGYIDDLFNTMYIHECTPKN